MTYTTRLLSPLTLALLLLPGCTEANALDGAYGVEPGQSGSGGASGSNLLPCSIAQILSDHCAHCHSSPPRYGAPTALGSVADFHQRSVLDSSLFVGQQALSLIHAPDSASMRMPPRGGAAPPLEPADLELLTRWLNARAPGDPQGCGVIDPEAPAGAGGQPGFGGQSFGGQSFGGQSFGGQSFGGQQPGSGGGPGWGGATGEGGQSNVGGDTGAGGSPVVGAPSGLHIEPYPGWDADPELECYKFVAHDGSKQGKYRVGTATDAYFGFTFMPPWQGTRYVRAFRRITDNAQVLHHWLLFMQPGAVADGAVSPQIGAHPDGQLVHGWAPGGSDAYLTPDIGVEVPSTRGFMLELHYNSRDANAMDASGVEVCVTPTKPENVAILSWLGTDAINSATATGTCRPRGNERIRIIAGTPHMHLKGRHMKVVINRQNGTQEIAHDEEFGFENQRIYPEDIWLEPGDTITTSCTFSGPSSFGPGTNQEMCYWFAMHYPALALSDGALLGTLIHGTNSCLGQ